jgi:hypothetical protein
MCIYAVSIRSMLSRAKLRRTIPSKEWAHLQSTRGRVCGVSQGQRSSPDTVREGHMRLTIGSGGPVDAPVVGEGQYGYIVSRQIISDGIHEAYGYATLHRSEPAQSQAETTTADQSYGYKDVSPL